MAGLNPTDPLPRAITLHGASRLLEVAFSDGVAVRLPFELLRVYSPSAEVQGHAPGQQVLQTGKRNVTVTALEPIGNYGVKPVFSDGHDTGIFTWAYLYELGTGLEARWASYLQGLEAAGASRDVPTQGASAPSCGGRASGDPGHSHG